MQIKIAIIGAGMAGVTLANALAKHAHLTLFEKARGVGGRMSTRRHGADQFDHGAQYFTIRQPEFRQLLQPLIDAGTLAPWSARLAKVSSTQEQQTVPVSEPMWVGVPAMNAVVKALAEPFTVNLGCRITKVQRRQQQWLLHDDQGQQHGPFDWVISTLPAPQALEVLPDNLSFYTALQRVEIDPCFALMTTLDSPPAVDFDALQWQADAAAPLSWLALNHTKPGRSGSVTVVAHTTPTWAAAHLEADLETVQEIMLSEICNVLDLPRSAVNFATVHRWRYAKAAVHKGPSSYLDSTAQVAACGDWAHQGRVEAAFTSADNLAHTIRAQLAEVNR